MRIISELFHELLNKKLEIALTSDKATLLKTLIPGEKVTGIVVGKQGTLELINIKGQVVKAKSNIVLKTGSKVTLQVINNHYPVRLKLLNVFDDKYEFLVDIPKRYLRLKASELKTNHCLKELHNSITLLKQAPLEQAEPVLKKIEILKSILDIFNIDNAKVANPTQIKILLTLDINELNKLVKKIKTDISNIDNKIKQLDKRSIIKLLNNTENRSIQKNRITEMENPNTNIKNLKINLESSILLDQTKVIDHKDEVNRYNILKNKSLFVNRNSKKNNYKLDVPIKNNLNEKNYTINHKATNENILNEKENIINYVKNNYYEKSNKNNISVQTNDIKKTEVNYKTESLIDNKLNILSKNIENKNFTYKSYTQQNKNRSYLQNDFNDLNDKYEVKSQNLIEIKDNEYMNPKDKNILKSNSKLLDRLTDYKQTNKTNSIIEEDKLINKNLGDIKSQLSQEVLQNINTVSEHFKLLGGLITQLNQTGIPFLLIPLWFNRTDGFGHLAYWKDEEKEDNFDSNKLTQHLFFDLTLQNLGNIKIHVFIKEQKKLELIIWSSESTLEVFRKESINLKTSLTNQGFNILGFEFWNIKDLQQKGLPIIEEITDRISGFHKIT